MTATTKSKKKAQPQSQAQSTDEVPRLDRNRPFGRKDARKRIDDLKADRDAEGKTILLHRNGTQQRGVPSSPQLFGRCASRHRGLAPDDVHHSILGETHVPRDKPIGEPFLVQREHSLSLLVAGSLALFSTKDDTAGLSRSQTRFHPLPNEVTLELGQAGHDRAHELAAGGAEVEAEAGLGQHADLPGVEIIEGLDEILRAPSPPAEFSNKDRVDLPALGERHHFLTLGAIVLGTGRRFPEHRDDVVAGALGEGTQITFLAFAALIVGADAAVDCNTLSQVDSF